jgi:hypothetical protein
MEAGGAHSLLLRSHLQGCCCVFWWDGGLNGTAGGPVGRPTGGRLFSCVVACCIDAFRGRQIACASPTNTTSANALSWQGCQNTPVGGLFRRHKTDALVRRLSYSRGRLAMSPSMFDLVIPVNIRKRNMWGHATYSIPCSFTRGRVAPSGGLSHGLASDCKGLRSGPSPH